MAQVELLLPKMGESVAEATVTAWLKEEGDHVELEDGLLEIATDKVDSEVPSDYEGKLIKKLCKEGDVIEIGKPFAIIEVQGDVPVQSTPNDEVDIYAEAPADKSPEVKNVPQVAEVAKPVAPTNAVSNKNRFYSPLVKNIAKKESLSQQELDSIPGTGREGRLTKNDLLSYLKNKPAVTTTVSPINGTPENSKTTAAVSLSGADEIVEMDRMRKMIADHMVSSKQKAPHVTSVIEIDVTNLVNWRNNVKDEFYKKEGYKLTFTPLFIEAVAKAIKEFPGINISTEGDKIIKKKDVNIGMAVALPSGNLIVPVVKKANHMNLMGMAKSVNDLAVKSRENKLAPDDVKGGTFTITNIGTFGNIIGTPIINQPEVAILATGVIQKKPAVIETPEGDFIGIRQMMFMSMSYDHRVVDGMLGGSFLRKVGDYLEKFDINRQIW